MAKKSEITVAVLEALSRLKRATWRVIYEVLLASGVQTTAKTVRKALENLSARNVVARIDSERVPGSRRPMRVYGPPKPPADVVPLGQIMNLWGAPAGTQ